VAEGRTAKNDKFGRSFIGNRGDNEYGKQAASVGEDGEWKEKFLELEEKHKTTLLRADGLEAKLKELMDHNTALSQERDSLLVKLSNVESDLMIERVSHKDKLKFTGKKILELEAEIEERKRMLDDLKAECKILHDRNCELDMQVIDLKGKSVDRGNVIADLKKKLADCASKEDIEEVKKAKERLESAEERLDNLKGLLTETGEVKRTASSVTLEKLASLLGFNDDDGDCPYAYVLDEVEVLMRIRNEYVTMLDRKESDIAQGIEDGLAYERELERDKHRKGEMEVLKNVIRDATDFSKASEIINREMKSIMNGAFRSSMSSLRAICDSALGKEWVDDDLVYEVWAARAWSALCLWLHANGGGKCDVKSQYAWLEVRDALMKEVDKIDISSDDVKQVGDTMLKIIRDTLVAADWDCNMDHSLMQVANWLAKGLKSNKAAFMSTGLGLPMDYIMNSLSLTMARTASGMKGMIEGLIRKGKGADIGCLKKMASQLELLEGGCSAVCDSSLSNGMFKEPEERRSAEVPFHSVYTDGGVHDVVEGVAVFSSNRDQCRPEETEKSPCLLNKPMRHNMLYNIHGLAGIPYDADDLVWVNIGGAAYMVMLTTLLYVNGRMVRPVAKLGMTMAFLRSEIGEVKNHMRVVSDYPRMEFYVGRRDHDMDKKQYRPVTGVVGKLMCSILSNYELTWFDWGINDGKLLYRAEGTSIEPRAVCKRGCFRQKRARIYKEYNAMLKSNVNK